MKVQKGFTIVELLIVIVVIGLLAAITVVAYNGVQQRSTNAAIIAAAKQTVSMVTAYRMTYDKYPGMGGYCVTTDNSCVNYNQSVVTSDNTGWLNELKKVGVPVSSIPITDTTRYGLYIDLYSPRTYNHNPIPGLLMYWLKGSNQPCQLQDVVMGDSAPLPGETNPFITSTNPWTSTGSGWTKCWVSL